MYPEEKLTQNQVPYKDQIKSVQTAVDDFQKIMAGFSRLKQKKLKHRFFKNIPLTLKRLHLNI